MSKRRQSKGRAWHWQQTDAWYYTVPGTKRRVPLFDERRRPIRGKERKADAELALARLRVAGKWRLPATLPGSGEMLVATACSEYLQHIAQIAMNNQHRSSARQYLNDFCTFCGALPLSELRKGHVEVWADQHPTWRSPVTRRNALTFVLSALNHAAENHGISNPLRGLKKPPPRPRLQSFAPEDETALYAAAEKAFRDFLFAAIHTGLRPFCELARLTGDAVIETERGMMWRVCSSKTGKTRKIPVRTEVADLARKLIRVTPSGPLFRRPAGKPWFTGAAGERFRRIKKELGWDRDPRKRSYTCYTARHTFAHRMLSGHWNAGIGCSIETLAELMGDTPKVAFDHYGKEWGQHYQAPLWAALGIPAHGAS